MPQILPGPIPHPKHYNSDHPVNSFYVLLGDEVAELVVAGGLVPKLLVGETDAVERIVVKSLAGIREIQIEGVLAAGLKFGREAEAFRDLGLLTRSPTARVNL